MAGPYYLRSTDGSDSDDGLSWTNALATYDGVEAVISTNEICYVSQVHAESIGSSAILIFPGGSIWLGVNDGAEPPTAEATGNNATQTASSGDWTLRGGGFLRNLKWTCGPSGTADLVIFTADNLTLKFDTCTFATPSNLANRTIGSQVTNGGNLVLQSCVFDGATTVAGIGLRGSVDLLDCTINGGAMTALFITGPTGQRHQQLNIKGLKASSAGSGAYVLSITNSNHFNFIMTNASLPSSFGWRTGTIYENQRVEIYNADSGDVHTSFFLEELGASVTDETTIVRTGGGTVSHRFDSSASCDNKIHQFAGMRGARYNDSVGSSMTLTIPLVIDSATALTDIDVWVNVWQHGTSGTPETVLATSKGDILGSGTTLTSSSHSWSGTSGFSNEQKRQLEVSFTPQEVGQIEYSVVLGKASLTALYVDHDGAELS